MTTHSTYRCIRAGILSALCFAAVAASSLPARTVEVGPADVIEVRARARFATTVVLPRGERILDWVCGDADYWSVQGAANLAFVKPTAEGVSTNVTLVTDQGRVYTLLFRETGADGEPDLKVFLRPTGDEAPLAGLPPVRFEPRGAAAALEEQVAEAHRQAAETERRAHADVADRTAAFRAAYPSKLRFDYVLDSGAGKAPFRVEAMWRDDRFTYIRAEPEETPALYESRDGRPSLVPYDFGEGLYVTRRLLGDGWLQIGKRKLRFQRERGQ